jgi:hypothetical protein
MSNNKTITSLDIRKNEFDTSIFDIIKHNNALIKLNMNNCELFDFNWRVYMFSALSINTVLKELLISNVDNAVSDIDDVREELTAELEYGKENPDECEDKGTYVNMMLNYTNISLLSLEIDYLLDFELKYLNSLTSLKLQSRKEPGVDISWLINNFSLRHIYIKYIRRHTERDDYDLIEYVQRRNTKLYHCKSLVKLISYAIHNMVEHTIKQ